MPGSVSGAGDLTGKETKLSKKNQTNFTLIIKKINAGWWGKEISLT